MKLLNLNFLNSLLVLFTLPDGLVFYNEYYCFDHWLTFKVTISLCYIINLIHFIGNILLDNTRTIKNYKRNYFWIHVYYDPKSTGAPEGKSYNNHRLQALRLPEERQQRIINTKQQIRSRSEESTSTLPMDSSCYILLNHNGLKVKLLLIFVTNFIDPFTQQFARMSEQSREGAVLLKAARMTI